MHVQSITTVLPVDDLDAAVAAFGSLLGIEPTFVDGDGWAQFDLDGRRIALAGTDRTSDKAGVMLKVDDLPAAREALAQAGFEPGEIEEGGHELRVQGTGPGGWPVVAYVPKPQ